MSREHKSPKNHFSVKDINETPESKFDENDIEIHPNGEGKSCEQMPLKHTPPVNIQICK